MHAQPSLASLPQECLPPSGGSTGQLSWLLGALTTNLPLLAWCSQGHGASEVCATGIGMSSSICSQHSLQVCVAALLLLGNKVACAPEGKCKLLQVVDADIIHTLSNARKVFWTPRPAPSSLRMYGHHPIELRSLRLQKCQAAWVTVLADAQASNALVQSRHFRRLD